MSIRWGFLGAGGVATTALAPAVKRARHAVLQAVASRDPHRSRALEPTKIHASYDDLLEDTTVDAVYISLANHQHHEWVIKALGAGKHVLCEKPLALNHAEALEMVDAAAANDRLLVEAVWSRWHPRFARMVELVKRGDLGVLRSIDSAFTFPGSLDGNYRLDQSMGGGSLLDVGPYLIHAWAACVDELARLDITSVERHLGPTGIDLTTMVSGVIDGHLDVSAIASFEREEHQRLVLTGDVTTAEFMGNEAFTSWHSASALRIGERQEQFDPVDPYALMVESVGARIFGEAHWLPSLTDSLQVMKVLDQIASHKNS